MQSKFNELEQGKEHTRPTLYGDHIWLRPCLKQDFDAIKAYRQAPGNNRYINTLDSDDNVREIVQQYSSSWRLEEAYWNGLVICEKSKQQVIGEVVFKIEDWTNQRAEIGYRLSPAVSGKGYCTEATKLLMCYLFKSLGIHKIVAKCDPRNVASYKVMEKLGMLQEGNFKQHYWIRGEWTDQLDYGVLHHDWKY